MSQNEQWKNDYKDERDKENSKLRFIKFDKEKTFVRIVGHKVVKVWTHYLTYQYNGEEKKTNVVCLGKDKCPICLSGNQAKRRVFYNVIDRNEQKENDGKFQVRILGIGQMVFKQIAALANDEEYGDPTKYDLRITKTGQGLKTEYVVHASPKPKPYTPEEIAIFKLPTEKGGMFDLETIPNRKTKEELEKLVNQNTSNNLDEEITPKAQKTNEGILGKGKAVSLDEALSELDDIKLDDGDFESGKDTAKKSEGNNEEW